MSGEQPEDWRDDEAMKMLQSRQPATDQAAEETADERAPESEVEPEVEPETPLANVTDVAAMGKGAGEHKKTRDTLGRTMYLGEDLLRDIELAHKQTDAEFCAEYGLDLPFHAFNRVCFDVALDNIDEVHERLGLLDERDD